MTELATIARPYARAAFAAASDAGELVPWSQFLAAASAAVDDQRVASLIGNPRVATPTLVDFILELSGARDPGGPERRFLQLLADSRRLSLLPEIASLYEVRRADAENRADVEVVAAAELSSEQQQQLRNALERRLQRGVRLHTRIDPHLLAGAVVRYKDFVIDGSLRGRIDRLGAALSGV